MTTSRLFYFVTENSESNITSMLSGLCFLLLSVFMPCFSVVRYILPAFFLLGIVGFADSDNLQNMMTLETFCLFLKITLDCLFNGLWEKIRNELSILR